MSAIVDLPLDHVLVVDNYRDTYDMAYVETLAANMRKRGFIRKRAIGVYAVELGNTSTKQLETFYAVIDGNTRALAARKAELATIPAEISLRDPKANKLDQLAENENRRKPDDISLAKGIKDAMILGATMAEVLESIGQTDPGYVDRRLALLSLIPEIQELVAKKHLPITFAGAMSSLDSNRQRMAVQAYNKAQSPSIPAFKAMCERLYAEQVAESQTDFFGLYTPEEMAAKEAELAESISSEPKRSLKQLEAELEAEKQARIAARAMLETERKKRIDDRAYALAKFQEAQQEIVKLKAELYGKGLAA